MAPVLGFSWRCRWVAMLAMTVTGKVVTAKEGTETGNSFRQYGGPPMYNNIKKCPYITFIFRRPSARFYTGK